MNEEALVFKSDDWVSVNEAAAKAGVSRRTIYNWHEAGRLKAARTASGRIRIHVSSLALRPEQPEA
jgi:excisionase family DNA binding protein